MAHARSPRRCHRSGIHSVRNVTGSPGAVNAGNDTGTNRRRIGQITTGPILRMLDLAIHTLRATQDGESAGVEALSVRLTNVNAPGYSEKRRDRRGLVLQRRFRGRLQAVQHDRRADMRDAFVGHQHVVDDVGQRSQRSRSAIFSR